ncbi:MAG: hypothetical protein JWR19_4468 [Pedosphaera sp.]|nr:hypothetical protein [Pedosphaera sp.]
MNRRNRPIFIVIGVFALAGLATWVGLAMARNTHMTAVKAREYVTSINLAKLSASDRARSIRELADKVNALSLEERRLWWMEGHWREWFPEMTEEEREQFIESTLPTGFKQVINAFEDLPDDRRKKAIDDAIKHLQETHLLPVDREPGRETSAYGTNAPPPLSPDLEKKVRALGFKTFYNESSAQTKAELAPLLEELQHQIQNGRAPF